MVLPPHILIPVLAILGLVCLFFGWSLYRVAMVALVVVAGGVTALFLAQRANLSVPLALVVAGIAAILCGLISHWVERVGAFLAGGTAGLLLLMQASGLFEHAHNFYVTALIAFLAGGSFAVLLLRPAMTLATAVLGAVCLERAALLFSDWVRPGLRRELLARYPLAAIAAFFLLVTAGVLFQAYCAPAPNGPADRKSGASRRDRR